MGDLPDVSPGWWGTDHHGHLTEKSIQIKHNIACIRWILMVIVGPLMKLITASSCPRRPGTAPRKDVTSCCREMSAVWLPLCCCCCCVYRVCRLPLFLLHRPTSSQRTGCSSTTWHSRSMVCSGPSGTALMYVYINTLYIHCSVLMSTRISRALEPFF